MGGEGEYIAKSPDDDLGFLALSPTGSSFGVGQSGACGCGKRLNVLGLVWSTSAWCGLAQSSLLKGCVLSLWQLGACFCEHRYRPTSFIPSEVEQQYPSREVERSQAHKLVFWPACLATTDFQGRPWLGRRRTSLFTGFSN